MPHIHTPLPSPQGWATPRPHPEPFPVTLRFNGIGSKWARLALPPKTLPAPSPSPPPPSPREALPVSLRLKQIGSKSSSAWGGAFLPHAPPYPFPRAPHIDPAVPGTVINSLSASVWRRMCQHRCIDAVAISTMVRYLDVDISTPVSQHRSGTSISVSRHLYLGVGISAWSRTSKSLLGVAPPTKNGHAPPPRQ